MPQTHLVPSQNKALSQPSVPTVQGVQNGTLWGQMMDYPLTVTRILMRMCQVVANREIKTKKQGEGVHVYTYKDCYQRICKLAHGLKQLGIQSGDRIGTLAWNCFEHMELYFAVPCMGSVIHTLNLRLSPEQLVYIINHAEDRVIFVDVTLAPLLEKIASQLTSVEKFILIGASSDASKDFKTSLPNVLHYEDLLNQSPSPEFEWPHLDENQAAALCYTSGTTGNPKGVLYSHRSQYLHSMGVLMADVMGLSSGDTVMAVVPLFHANAWGLPYAATLAGANLVFPGPHLLPSNLAQLIQDCKVTLGAGVPTIWMGLFQELKSGVYDFSELRALIVGGAAMPRSLIEAYEEELGIPIVHAWGMTELSPLGTSSSLLNLDRNMTPGQRYDKKARQGAAAPGIEIRIVGETGEVLPWDGKTPGELQVRGPWVASSYFKESSLPQCSSQFTNDGWFVTGDVANIDASGSMSIVDRSKDLIKSGGEWISSVALENVLMAHPGIKEAAVIGIPDEKWSERPLALIVPLNGSVPSTEELRCELSKSFVKFWIPEKFKVIAEIPKTSVGKFNKKLLRQWFSEGKL